MAFPSFSPLGSEVLTGYLTCAVCAASQGHAAPTLWNEKVALLLAHVTRLPARRLFLTANIFIESGPQLGLTLN